MVKKRRDFNKCEFLDLRGRSGSFNEEIGVETASGNSEGILCTEHHLRPFYGQGHIHCFHTETIELTLSKYKLNNDIVLHQAFDHDFIQISFLLEGEKTIYMDGRDDILYEGGESYLAGIRSFNGHSRISSTRFFNEIKIRLPISFFKDNDLADELDIKGLADENLILPLTDELLKILASLQNIGNKRVGKKIYLKAKAFELLAILMENYRADLFNSPSTNKNRNLKRLYQVRNIVRSHLHKNFSIGELSKEVGFSTNVLSREFKRVFGYSISEFSTIEKMTKAKELLKGSQQTIYQIAEEVGYKNATHFSAAFKRNVGVTPKQHRGNIKIS